MDKEKQKSETNEDIIESLEDVLSIAKELNCQLRIFGSLIYAVLKGEFYRKVGDIDCFVDIKSKKAIVEELEKKGYIKIAGRDEDVPRFLYFIGFRTENFTKYQNKLSLIFVSFKEKYLEIPLRFGFSFRVPYNLINKEYKFYGKEFRGLIPEAALFNLAFVKDKIKRKTDTDILLPFCDFDVVKKIRTEDTFFWFNKKIPLISAILASKIDKFLPR